MNFPADKNEQINYFLVNSLHFLDVNQCGILIKNLTERMPAIETRDSRVEKKLIKNDLFR